MISDHSKNILDIFFLSFKFMLDVFEVFYVGRVKFVIDRLRDSFEESSESRNREMLIENQVAQN